MNAAPSNHVPAPCQQADILGAGDCVTVRLQGFDGPSAVLLSFRRPVVLVLLAASSKYSETSLLLLDEISNHVDVSHFARDPLAGVIVER